MPDEDEARIEESRDPGEAEEDETDEETEPLILAVGDDPAVSEHPDSLVSTPGPWIGLSRNLVGFDNLSPKKALRELLKGKLFPEMPQRTRLAIAEGIANELMTSDSQAEDCRMLMDEVSDALLELDQQEHGS